MAAAEARSVRSHQQHRQQLRRSGSLAPSSRPQTRTVAQRPVLHVISHTDDKRNFGIVDRIRAVADNQRRSLTVFIVSLVCLVASLGGTLMLRTVMTENAYSITQTQSSVSQLRQDVQQDQEKLNDLESSLPERATQMGMQQGSSSMTVDLGNAQ